MLLRSQGAAFRRANTLIVAECILRPARGPVRSGSCRSVPATRIAPCWDRCGVYPPTSARASAFGIRRAERQPAQSATPEIPEAAWSEGGSGSSHPLLFGHYPALFGSRYAAYLPYGGPSPAGSRHNSLKLLASPAGFEPALPP